MIKLVKWIWHQAEQRAIDGVVWQIESRGQYHRQQAEIAYLKDRYEPKTSDMHDFRDLMLTPKEHSAVAKAMKELAQQLMSAQSQTQPSKNAPEQLLEEAE